MGDDKHRSPDPEHEYIEIHLLLGAKIMCLVGDIIPDLHLETCCVEELAVVYRRSEIPDFDDVKLTLGRQSDPRDTFILLGEHLLGEAVDHTVEEHVAGLGCINLLRPCATLVVLGGVPQRANSLAHQEEHPGIPCLGGDRLYDGPEVLCGYNTRDLDVAVERIVRVVGIVIPQHPRLWQRSGIT